jgi:hypothetical protein
MEPRFGVETEWAWALAEPVNGEFGGQAEVQSVQSKMPSIPSKKHANYVY